MARRPPTHPDARGGAQRSWRPILTGRLAACARDAIRGIADDLPRHALASEAGLGAGHAGLAVFFGHAERCGIIDPGRADDHLDQALAIMAATVTSPTLYAGFVGIAWVVQHLESLTASETELSEPDLEDSEIDEALVRHVATSPGAFGYDLVYGLTGIGIYALARRPRRLADQLLQAIVVRLEEAAERIPSGLALPTQVSELPDDVRDRYPMGHYNLGVSHGVPGVIGLLGAVPGVRAKALREEFVAWLRRIRSSAADGSLYASTIDRRDPVHRNTGCRAAWCYGDPGIAAALLRSARAAGDPAQEALALEIGLAAAARSPDTAGAGQPGLCHGAAGLLHLFNRLYQATAAPAFGDAALCWAERTLAMRGEGVGGFRDCDGPGFLHGAAGVGLALLAAIGEVEPSWDAVLVCDVPPLTAGAGGAASPQSDAITSGRAATVA